jgi:4-hydroxy-tetrahydrodipicolinate synthase
MDTARIQQALSGPIASIRTPFSRDGSIDYESLRRIVDFDIEAGSGALLITWGDSLFSLLSDRDVADLTRAVVKYAAGRAVVVASTGRWATPQAVEFAAFCREAGADILLVFLPMWYPGTMQTAAIVAHHRAMAAHIPLMTNSAELQRQGEAVGLDVARTLLGDGQRVLAMKADVMGDFDRKMTSLVKDHWTMFAGGTKPFHLELWPYGCQGYLSTFITFRPSVTRAYWRAIGAGDIPAATRIITDLDRPFFDYILGVPGGFDAAMHGVTELCGLTQRWRRPPFHSLTDAEMEGLAALLDRLAEAEKGIPSP